MLDIFPLLEGGGGNDEDEDKAVKELDCFWSWRWWLRAEGELPAGVNMREDGCGFGVEAQWA